MKLTIDCKTINANKKKSSFLLILWLKNRPLLPLARLYSGDVNSSIPVEPEKRKSKAICIF
jgi:hypothetical protein